MVPYFKPTKRWPIVRYAVRPTREEIRFRVLLSRPSPDRFEAALRDAGVSPKSVVMIGLFAIWRPLWRSRLLGVSRRICSVALNVGTNVLHLDGHDGFPTSKLRLLEEATLSLSVDLQQHLCRLLGPEHDAPRRQQTRVLERPANDVVLDVSYGMERRQRPGSPHPPGWTAPYGWEISS